MPGCAFERERFVWGAKRKKASASDFNNRQSFEAANCGPPS